MVIGVTPGADGLLILSLIHCLLEAGKVDLDYLARFTNAPLLVRSDEGAEKGLFLRDAQGKALVVEAGKLVPFDAMGVKPDLGATYEGHRTVFQHMALLPKKVSMRSMRWPRSSNEWNRQIRTS